MLMRYCKKGCKTVVESTLGTAFSTKYTETILCPKCRADNSLRPSLWWRFKHAQQRARKLRRVYGWLWWRRYAPWRCLLTPSEGG